MAASSPEHPHSPRGGQGPRSLRARVALPHEPVSSERVRWMAGLVVLLAALAPGRAGAVQVEALDPAREWRPRALRLPGHGARPTPGLRGARGAPRGPPL